MVRGGAACSAKGAACAWSAPAAPVTRFGSRPRHRSLRDGDAVPWGADVIAAPISRSRVPDSPAAVARRVGKQSVNVALGAATLGALVSAGGLLPMTGRRVIAVVNAASFVSMLNGTRASYNLVRRALPPPRDRTPWHAIDARAVVRRLGTGPDGLERKEALARRRPELAPRSNAAELLEAITDELFNPLAPLLAAGAGLSAAVGSFGDAAMVGGVAALNALIGGVQRHRTERAIRDLSRAPAGDARWCPRRPAARDRRRVLGARRPGRARCGRRRARRLPHPRGRGARGRRFQHDRRVHAGEEAGGGVVRGRRAGPQLHAVRRHGHRRRSRHRRCRSRRGRDRSAPWRRRQQARQRPRRRRASPAIADSTDGSGRHWRRRRLGRCRLLRGESSRTRGQRRQPGGGVGAGRLALLATAAQLAAAERLAKRGALVRNARSIEALGRVDVLCWTDRHPHGGAHRARLRFGRHTEQRLPDLDAVTLPILGAGVRASASAAAARSIRRSKRCSAQPTSSSSPSTTPAPAFSALTRPRSRRVAAITRPAATARPVSCST